MADITNLNELKDIVIRYKNALEAMNEWEPFIVDANKKVLDSLGYDKASMSFLSFVFNKANILLNNDVSAINKRYISSESGVRESLKKYSADVLTFLNEVLDAIIEKEAEILRNKEQPKQEPIQQEPVEVQNPEQQPVEPPKPEVLV